MWEEECLPLPGSTQAVWAAGALSVGQPPVKSCRLLRLCQAGTSPCCMPPQDGGCPLAASVGLVSTAHALEPLGHLPLQAGPAALRGRASWSVRLALVQAGTLCVGGVIRGVCTCGEQGKGVPGEVGLGAGRDAGGGQVPACLPTASRDWKELGLCICVWWGGAGGQGRLRTPEYMVILDGQSHQAALHSALRGGAEDEALSMLSLP